jgi:hypothetical protein
MKRDELTSGITGKLDLIANSSYYTKQTHSKLPTETIVRLKKTKMGGNWGETGWENITSMISMEYICILCHNGR